MPDFLDRRLFGPLGMVDTGFVTRDVDRAFLRGQGWGFGGSVDITVAEPWNAPGRYGWVGGTGTAAYVVPSTDTATILLSQVDFGGPDGAPLLDAFPAAAA